MSEEIEKELCPICHRILGTENVNQHHLIPKSRKGKEKFHIHKICHRKIHATFTEKELEKKFNTWDELRNHEMMQDFIKWVQKKPPEFYDGSVTSNRRR